MSDETTLSGLPGRPIQITTLTQLESAEKIERCLPVVGSSTGDNTAKDIVVVFYMRTVDRQALVGLADETWTLIETVAPDAGFELTESELKNWVETENPMPPELLHGYATNAADYPMY